MADMEKVIKALEFCTDQRTVDTCYGECPYAVADDDYKCLQMKLDALALLKEHEEEQLKFIEAIARLTAENEMMKMIYGDQGKVVGELVRCKDCRYGEPVKNGAGDDCIQCNNDDLWLDGNVNFPDWFCADGKPKEV